jgi:hypothetical protein
MTLEIDRDRLAGMVDESPGERVLQRRHGRQIDRAGQADDWPAGHDARRCPQVHRTQGRSGVPRPSRRSLRA